MSRKLTALLMIATLLLVMTNAFAWSCPGCRNEMDGKFCSECGAKKPENICVSCGTNFGDNSPKFCSECGAKVGAKNVTVTEELTASAKGLLSDVKVTITLNEDGTISTMAVDVSGETQAIAAPCTEEAYLSQFIGKKGPFTADVVAGATFTSNAVINAVNSLFPAEEAVAPAVGSMIELQALTYDELVALKDKINLAIWNSQEWREVEVPQGVWLVGQDIPAGHWTIKTNANYARITTGTALDETGKYIDTWNSTFSYIEGISSPNYKHFDPNSDISEIDLDLKAGTYIVIECGSVIFTPYAGKPSLGFK